MFCASVPNEGEESMCVLKVNGLLSGGQSRHSCGAAQTNGGVGDHKRVDKLSHQLHCRFIPPPVDGEDGKGQLLSPAIRDDDR